MTRSPFPVLKNQLSELDVKHRKEESLWPVVKGDFLLLGLPTVVAY